MDAHKSNYFYEPVPIRLDSGLVGLVSGRFLYAIEISADNIHLPR